MRFGWRPSPSLLSRLGLGVLACVVACYGWWPALAGWNRPQIGDGAYFHKLLEAARISIVRYHELPLWDPYECGGRPLWDNPQSFIASPIAWLALIVGTTFTMKLWYVLHSAAGFVSMWMFSRRVLDVSRAASFVGATAWAFCGFNMHHLVGHVAFVGFELMPLAVWLWRLAERDDRGAVALGLLVALLGFEGGALPLLYIAVLLACESVTRIWALERVWRMVRAGPIVLVVALGVGAVRLFPVIDQLRSHKRPLPPDLDHMSASMLWDAFTNRKIPHMEFLPGQAWAWGEYGAYVGPLLLAFAALGILFAGRRFVWLLVPLALGIALAVGHHGEGSPWTILHRHLYPLKEMRVPSRFLGQTSLVIVSYAALGIDRIGRLIERSSWRIAEWPHIAAFVVPMLGMLAAGDIVGRGLQLVSEYGAAGTPVPPPLWAEHLHYTPTSGYIEGPAQNLGRLECYEPWFFYEHAPLWNGDVPQARPLDPSAAEVRSATRTAHTFTLDVHVSTPTTILVNSSFDPNWRTTVGNTINSANALAVELPPGDHHVKLSYVPHYLALGFAVTLASIAALIALARRRAKR